MAEHRFYYTAYFNNDDFDIWTEKGSVRIIGFDARKCEEKAFKAIENKILKNDYFHYRALTAIDIERVKVIA